MATYDIDGIKYEIADGVDLVSTVSAIRALPSHKQPDKDPILLSNLVKIS